MFRQIQSFPKYVFLGVIQRVTSWPALFLLYFLLLCCCCCCCCCCYCWRAAYGVLVQKKARKPSLYPFHKVFSGGGWARFETFRKRVKEALRRLCRRTQRIYIASKNEMHAGPYLKWLFFVDFHLLDKMTLPNVE